MSRSYFGHPSNKRGAYRNSNNKQVDFKCAECTLYIYNFVELLLSTFKSVRTKYNNLSWRCPEPIIYGMAYTTIVFIHEFYLFFWRL